MAEMNIEAILKWGYRPCSVNGMKALFHIWCPKSGEPIVEFEDGMLDRVPLERVTFMDSTTFFKEFVWSKET